MKLISVRKLRTTEKNLKNVNQMIKKTLVGVTGLLIILAVSIPTIIYFTGDKQLSLVSSFNIGDVSEFLNKYHFFPKFSW